MKKLKPHRRHRLIKLLIYRLRLTPVEEEEEEHKEEKGEEEEEDRLPTAFQSAQEIVGHLNKVILN